MRNVIIIREYNNTSDKLKCKELIESAIMSHTSSAYFTFLFKEVVLQVMVLLAAICFIFLGLPIYMCICVVPLVALLVYLITYATHYMKGSQISESQPLKRWVAEAFEPYFLDCDPKDVKYGVFNDYDYKSEDIDTSTYSSKIVGVASVKDFYGPDNSLWLYGLAVSPKYRQKHVGKMLVRRVVDDASKNKFDSVEALTTDLQCEARLLFQKEGNKMFDESIDVLNAREVKSSNSSSDQDEIVEIMGKPKQPASRVEKRNDKYRSDSDSPEPERFINDLPMPRKSPEKAQNITHMAARRPQASRQVSREQSGNKKVTKISDSSENSDSDSNELEEMGIGENNRIRGRTAMVIPTEGAYDPQKYSNLDMGPEMNEIFQHILRYAPQKIDIDFKLKPFLPDYIPAVGDIDAFIKVVTPQHNLQGEKLSQKLLDKISELGLVVVDEPASNQSDPALLHLQLRAASKSNTEKTMVVKKIENADKNGKAIERWIRDVSELHQSKPPPTVHYTKAMPDIDTLMGAWPEKMESKLTEVGFPPASLDCSLSQYIDIVCGIFNIPVYPELGLNGKIQALHVLFTLYDAIKNEQVFKEKQQTE